MFHTPVCGWKRAFEKYSPSTEVKHSPVVQIQGKVKPTFNDDDTLITVAWGLSTQEEYYYQNFIELISIHKSDIKKMKKILTINRLPAYWSERLINFYLLGQGAFGKVYKTTDAVTEAAYALKEVTSYNKHKDKLLKNTVMIMTERNAHFRANESPFVVKLFGAFQDNRLNSYWLVFELCIGDLLTYVEFIKCDISQYYDNLLKEHVLNSFLGIYQEYSKLNTEKIGFIFTFELLAGIDYLAKRNLLHNDLKPENVLMSSRGHLKISDLGLTHRFRWLDRWSAAEFTEPASFKLIEDKEKIGRLIGNIKYTDPEVLIFFNLFYSSQKIYDRFKHEDFPLVDIHQNFLSDLYSVALIAIELIFYGMNFINSRDFTVKITQRFGIDRKSAAEHRIWPIRCSYDKDVNINFLERIIDNQKTSKNQSVLEFLKSCFKPRSERALEYTKTVSHMKLKESIENRCIDFEKVKEIEYFKTRRFTEYNITTMAMPSSLLNIYNTQQPYLKAKTFDELLTINAKYGKEPGQELPMVPFQFAL